MKRRNIEIKAKYRDFASTRAILQSLQAEFKGTDHQVDTYFNIPNGRLKLREGNIENYLIHYSRENKEGPKLSDVLLCNTGPGSTLKEILTKALGVLIVVDKYREIYFIDNVKFHLDNIEGLGTFIEIEAIDSDGSEGDDKLYSQCSYYMELLKISDSDLVSSSYSDLLLEKK